MKNKGNLYIISLKYCIDKMQEGVTFSELNNYLTKEMNWTFDDNFIDYFRLWFHKNFYNRDVSITLIHGNEAQIRGTVRGIATLDDIRCVMTAEAYEILLDYEKIQQSRNDSKSAQKLAYIAIWISGALAFIQIVLQMFSMCIS